MIYIHTKATGPHLQIPAHNKLSQPCLFRNFFLNICNTFIVLNAERDFHDFFLLKIVRKM